MYKIYKFLLATAIFVIGISIGLYYNTNVEIVKEPEKPIDSAQDAVIKYVQTKEETPVNSEEEKISPYASMTIEKYYNQCGHTSLDEIEIPVELVNLTEEELKQKYKNWEIRKFDSKAIHLYRTIDANCNSHFVVKEKDGYLAIYTELKPNQTQLHEITQIPINILREEDQSAIEAGVTIYGKAELSSFIEDFNS